jgi:hypothetical protein
MEQRHTIATGERLLGQVTAEEARAAEDQHIHVAVLRRGRRLRRTAC